MCGASDAVMCTTIASDAERQSLHIKRGAERRTLEAMCSEQRAGCQQRKVNGEREERTDGMTESRSLMVRSGMMTSFCATTLVTPPFVTVFMTGKKEERKEKVYGGTRTGTPLVCLKRKEVR